MKSIIKPISQKAVYILTIASAVFWYLIAHGYRMSNNLFSHDSLVDIYQDDSAWEISLGRFTHPLILLLRGGLTSPWIILFISLTLFIISSLLLVELFSFRTPISIVLVTGFIICNVTVTTCNAGYLPWCDIYIFALLSSILGVWFCTRENKLLVIPGIISFVLSMGTYPAYICFSIGLFLFISIKYLKENENILISIKKGLLFCLWLLVSAVLYMLVGEIIRKIFGIWTADHYNGVSSVGDYSDTSLISSIATAYKNFFLYFINPLTFKTVSFRGISLSVIWLILLRISALVLSVIAILCWFIPQIKIFTKLSVSKEKQNRLIAFCLQILGVLIIPLALNFVCVLSKGMEHELMYHSLCLVYIAIAYVIENTVLKDSKYSLLNVIYLICCICIIWSNVVFANQLYLKKSLQDKATTSLMTRIVDDIESSKDYEPGVTAVAFIGNIEDSPYLTQLHGFEEISVISTGITTTSYKTAFNSFIRYELNVPMNIITVDESNSVYKTMPCYPVRGSVEYIDGCLVVKLSE